MPRPPRIAKLRSATLSVGTALVASAFGPSAFAACTDSNPASGTTVVCSGPTVAPVLAQPGSTGVSIGIDATTIATFARTTAPVGFSVDTGSAIASSGRITLTGGGGTGTARGAGLLGTGNNNQVTNAAGAVIATTGAFNDGMAANGSGNTLTNHGSITTTGPSAFGMTAAWGQTNQGQLNNTLINTGTVSTAGSNARAASILGGSGTINNSGTLSTTGASSPAAYLQGNNDQLLNSGTITATGSGSDAVFSNTAGSSFTATIQNLPGGRIVSETAAAVRTLNGSTTIVNAGLIQSNAGTAISMGGGGADFLILQTGSTIIGTADGGDGIDSVTLQGTGTAANAFTNFQTLTMQGTAWDWTGSGTFDRAHVQTGTLNLLSPLGPNTSALVDPGATLQATAQTLPLAVTDNGLVRFAQQTEGTYGGMIAGSGAVTKSGAGKLTLAPAEAGGNTYAGGTNIDQGVLAVAADNALGAAAGGLNFGGGTLQFASGFDLGATRAVQLGAGGGTIDTQSFTTTLAQPVTGSGMLTKIGTGSLVMNGTSSFTGGTTVAAGTLAIGDVRHPAAALAGGGNIAVAAGASLGGYGAVTGAVSNAGTIGVADAMPLFAGGPGGTFTINGSLANAGLVQVGGRGVGNQLVVIGSYIGQNGTVGLNTVVGIDGSASDKLVISGGSASGATRLAVSNVGGTGAQTVGSGIQVVSATNGATTAAGAFTLASPVQAGAFSYYLAKGGVTAGTSDDWYLRNTVPHVTDPSSQTPTPIPAEGSPALPAPGPTAVALYRPEVPLYAAAPGVARRLGVSQIATFHERQGEQSLLTDAGTLSSSWGRVWGGHTEARGSGTVDPNFDGSTYGIQAGQDIYAHLSESGIRNRYGIFAGFARASGDVDGLALGRAGLGVGHLSVESTSLGGYWTQVGAGGWYTDAVLMGSSLKVDSRSTQFLGVDPNGSAFTASAEGGMPFTIADGLVIEPQAQLLWQHLSIDDGYDRVSTVRFDSGNTFVARLGVRLQGNFDAGGARWQPYMRLSVLRGFGSDDTTTFGLTGIDTGVGQTSAQLGAGIVARWNRSMSTFVTANWITNLGGSRQRALAGNAGMRWTW
ncbi:autotransporter domain-containing protein [Variovorax sp. J22P168]|uniref:autotransporter family protein n=1 Tax=Variovorax jilinensis TaxID=3053513 RepID=UPI002576C938|nr:autotransporter domain-containing protein [Variovorax sp. J22P168]MDM0015584.1 autotransporter domain-containing protein [Variovorax sp. J22P168]